MVAISRGVLLMIGVLLIARVLTTAPAALSVAP
jgi:hypothetical protein